MPFPSTMPSPRTPDPMAAPILRWGVLGTGWIAERFIAALRRYTRQQVVAVAARDAARAAAFAAHIGVGRGVGSYEELVAAPDVDVVYVATVHEAHLSCARLALQAGKHTLVEKPLALNAVQARELADLAAERGVFCAEALWSLYLPRYDVVRQILESGALGQVHTVLAEYSEHFTGGHRILNPDQVGGPLLDLGTYPISLATWVLGDPVVVSAVGRDHPSGVNGQIAAVLANSAGGLGVVHTSVFADTPASATLAGDHGTLTLTGHAYQPGDLLLTRAGGGSVLSYTEARTAHGALYFEAAEVARCVADGRLQTPMRPLADTVLTLEVMDEVRARCGIAYPGEAFE